MTEAGWAEYQIPVRPGLGRDEPGKLWLSPAYRLVRDGEGVMAGVKLCVRLPPTVAIMRQPLSKAGKSAPTWGIPPIATRLFSSLLPCGSRIETEPSAYLKGEIP